MAQKAKINEALVERLGTDAKFPIVENFVSIKGLDVLLQDIQALLLTIPGERVMRPDFGCDLRTYLWENIDEVAKKGPGSISTAIRKFEPRIKLTKVETSVNRNTGLITFVIRFYIKQTNTPVNLIFPVRTSQQIASA